LFTFCVGGIIPIPFILYFALYQRHPMGIFFLVLFILTSIVPLKFIPPVPNFILKFLRECFYHIIISNLRYFSIKMVWGKTLEPRQYMFLSVPHGLVPSAMGSVAPLIEEIFGGPPVKFGAADFFFRVPLMKEYMEFSSAIPASRDTLLKAINNGHSVCIVPDGVAGMFRVNDPDEVIYLRTHKGAARLALETGTPIVPCYVFGCTEQFSLWYDQFGILEFLARKLRLPLLFFWGRYGLWIPRRVPQTIIFGNPIPVSKQTSPNEEEVNNLQQKIVDEITRLFETHKQAYGWSSKKVRIE